MESASYRAVRQVMTWACEQGMSIRGLLSLPELEALAHVFAGTRPWSFELYEPLRAFSHAIPRLNLPDVPDAMHFGDVLTALNEVLLREGPAWETQSEVSPGTFAELGYAATSLGITRLQEQQTAAWRDHGVQNKELLLRALPSSAGSSATVVGAGKIYDIPLRKLAERFARLTLVDIDGESLAQSVEQARLTPELQNHLSLVTADVTGVNDTFVAGVCAALERPTEAATYDACLELLRSYRLQAPPPLAGAPTDVAFSSMVLSQLATPLTEYLQRRFAERFSDSVRLRAHEFQVALGQFSHRVQHSHIRALLATAPLVAISSDISEQFTELDAYENVSASVALPLIGAPHLEDLFPAQQAYVTSSNEWPWQRIVPTAAKPHGRSLQVVGCLAKRSPPSQT